MFVVIDLIFDNIHFWEVYNKFILKKLYLLWVTAQVVLDHNAEMLRFLVFNKTHPSKIDFQVVIRHIILIQIIHLLIRIVLIKIEDRRSSLIF